MNLEQKISREKLCDNLALLREALTDGRNYPPSHVFFFDNRSIYCHFASCPCGSTTIGEMLRHMEHCVPLALTEDSLQLFLSACKEEDAKRFSNSFLESSKADFLLLIRHAAQDESKWRAVITLCDGLRLQNR